MQFPQNLTKKITETAYLNTENTPRYRFIMRVFFTYHEQFRHWLKKEDVYAVLKDQPEFSHYTLEMCASDLDALTQWGNLTTVQDTAKVTTYQQFINKQFRYQMTEYAIEIERLMQHLETLKIEGGSLEPTLLERISSLVAKLPDILKDSDKNCMGWWLQLTNDFQRLNQNYQDYIRDWHSTKTENLLKTDKFLIYKDRLVDYLRNFIKELQLHGSQIEKSFTSFSASDYNALIDKLVRYELAVITLGDPPEEAQIRHTIAGKYDSIKGFFVSGHRGMAELDIILDLTNDIIRRITRAASNLLEMRHQYASRKEEYFTVAQNFLNLENLEACHKLSAQVFGATSYLHYGGDFVRTTEDIASSTYDEPAYTVIAKPRIQTYREKMIKSQIKDYAAEKAVQVEKILAMRQQEEQILRTYVASGKLSFNELPHIDTSTRRTLLRWLIKAINAGGKTITTEMGGKYHLINLEETARCQLKSEDGILDMPAYILEFEHDL